MRAMDVRAVRDNVVADLKERTARFKEAHGFAPRLVLARIGDDPASISYVRTKERLAAEIGIETENRILPYGTAANEARALIESLNSDESVNAILLQLPLPEGLNEFELVERIAPSKDADGFVSSNMGLLMKGKQDAYACTPKGIMRIFAHYGISLRSKRVLVINRSDIVGKPLAAALAAKGVDATVTIAHSRTEDIRELAEGADIIVTAVSRPGFIDKKWRLKDGVVVVDVSINRIADASSPKGYRVTGDFKPEDFSGKDGMYTPVPGGVGLMTVCELMDNTLILAERQMELSQTKGERE